MSTNQRSINHRDPHLAADAADRAAQRAEVIARVTGSNPGSDGLADGDELPT